MMYCFWQQLKEILRRIPEETRKELREREHNPEEEYIIEYLRVPMVDTGNLPSVPLPNYLSVADVSHGYINLSVSHLKLNSCVEFIECLTCV